MRAIFFILLLVVYFNPCWSQNRIEWKAGYQLSVVDFQAERPRTGQVPGNGYFLAANLEFNPGSRKLNKHLGIPSDSFVMAYFTPSQSWLEQGEGTEILLQYAQMDFDLLELYARKYRKQIILVRSSKLYPALLPLIQTQIETELKRHAAEMQRAAAESEEKRRAFHTLIRKEIDELDEFCRKCGW